MSERRIGLIPNATQTGQEKMAVLVTDQRTIVIQDEAPVQGFKDGMRQLFGAEADKPLEPRPAIDYATVDIQHLASMKGNQSIPHLSILEGRIGKGIGGYGVWIKMEGENMNKDYFVLTFLPPPDLVRAKKAEGISKRKTEREYALKCVEVFRRAIPPLVAEKLEWKT